MEPGPPSRQLPEEPPLGRTANGSQTSTGVDSDGADQIKTPLGDSVSEMATVGPTTSGESGTISRGGPEAIVTADQEVPRPDPMEDPRREAAIRHRVARTSINREAPGTGAIAQSATDGTDGVEASTRSTDGTTRSTGAITRAADRISGTTQQSTTGIRGSAVQYAVALAPEPSTDLEVNGPYWDSHVVDHVPESDEDARARIRLMHQASRRAIHRGRNAVDQQFILALQDQVDRGHDGVVAVTEELERFHQGAREMRGMQKTHRANNVQYIANLRQSINQLQQRIRDLEAQVNRLEHAAEGLLWHSKHYS